jgi:toxin FitB
VIILDTNVLSEPLRPAPDPAVIGWLDKQVIETLYLTTISLAEIRYGIAALPVGRRRQSLHDRFEGDVVPLFVGRTLTFDADASRAYASLRATAPSVGLHVGGFDALIAGIAASRSMAVATRDTAPFVAAQVRVIDPFRDGPGSPRDRH